MASQRRNGKGETTTGSDGVSATFRKVWRGVSCEMNDCDWTSHGCDRRHLLEVGLGLHLQTRASPTTINPPNNSNKQFANHLNLEGPSIGGLPRRVLVVSEIMLALVVALLACSSEAFVPSSITG